MAWFIRTNEVVDGVAKLGRGINYYIKQKIDIIPYLTDGEHPVDLPTPADRRGSTQCWTFRSAPNVPTAQRTDSNKLLVTVDLPLAQ